MSDYYDDRLHPPRARPPLPYALHQYFDQNAPTYAREGRYRAGPSGGYSTADDSRDRISYQSSDSRQRRNTTDDYYSDEEQSGRSDNTSADNNRNRLTKKKRRKEKRKKEKKRKRSKKKETSDEEEGSDGSGSDESVRSADIESSIGSSDSEMDLEKPLKPIGGYLKTRPEMVEQMWHAIKPHHLKRMTPKILRKISIDQLKQLCADELNGMSKKRIRYILAGRDMTSSSGTEESSDSEEDDEITAMRETALKTIGIARVKPEKAVADSTTTVVVRDGVAPLADTDGLSHSPSDAAVVGAAAVLSPVLVPLDPDMALLAEEPDFEDIILDQGEDEQQEAATIQDQITTADDELLLDYNDIDENEDAANNNNSDDDEAEVDEGKETERALLARRLLLDHQKSPPPQSEGEEPSEEKDVEGEEEEMPEEEEWKDSDPGDDGMSSTDSEFEPPAEIQDSIGVMKRITARIEADDAKNQDIIRADFDQNLKLLPPPGRDGEGSDSDENTISEPVTQFVLQQLVVRTIRIETDEDESDEEEEQLESDYRRRQTQAPAPTLDEHILRQFDADDGKLPLTHESTLVRTAEQQTSSNSGVENITVWPPPCPVRQVSPSPPPSDEEAQNKDGTNKPKKVRGELRFYNRRLVAYANQQCEVNRGEGESLEPVVCSPPPGLEQPGVVVDEQLLETVAEDFMDALGSSDEEEIGDGRPESADSSSNAGVGPPGVEVDAILKEPLEWFLEPPPTPPPFTTTVTTRQVQVTSDTVAAVTVQEEVPIVSTDGESSSKPPSAYGPPTLEFVEADENLESAKEKEADKEEGEIGSDDDDNDCAKSDSVSDRDDAPEVQIEKDYDAVLESKRRPRIEVYSASDGSKVIGDWKSLTTDEQSCGAEDKVLFGPENLPEHLRQPEKDVDEEEPTKLLDSNQELEEEEATGAQQEKESEHVIDVEADLITVDDAPMEADVAPPEEDMGETLIQRMRQTHKDEKFEKYRREAAAAVKSSERQTTKNQGDDDIDEEKEPTDDEMYDSDVAEEEGEGVLPPGLEPDPKSASTIAVQLQQRAEQRKATQRMLLEQREKNGEPIEEKEMEKRKTSVVTVKALYKQLKAQKEAKKNRKPPKVYAAKSENATTSKEEGKTKKKKVTFSEELKCEGPSLPPPGIEWDYENSQPNTGETVEMVNEFARKKKKRKNISEEELAEKMKQHKTDMDEKRRLLADLIAKREAMTVEKKAIKKKLKRNIDDEVLFSPQSKNSEKKHKIEISSRCDDSPQPCSSSTVTDAGHSKSTVQSATHPRIQPPTAISPLRSQSRSENDDDFEAPTKMDRIESPPPNNDEITSTDTQPTVIAVSSAAASTTEESSKNPELELYELELRARAIRALMNRGDDE